MMAPEGTAKATSLPSILRCSARRRRLINYLFFYNTKSEIFVLGCAANTFLLRTRLPEYSDYLNFASNYQIVTLRDIV